PDDIKALEFKPENQQAAEAIKRELEEGAKKYEGKFLDVDNDKYLLQKRAGKWAEYDIKLFTENTWRNLLLFLWKQDEKERQKRLEDIIANDIVSLYYEERVLIWTTRPHAHKALFVEEVIKRYIDGAMERRYISYGGGTSNIYFREKALSLLKNSPGDYS